MSNAGGPAGLAVRQYALSPAVGVEGYQFAARSRAPRAILPSWRVSSASAFGPLGPALRRGEPRCRRGFQVAGRFPLRLFSCCEPIGHGDPLLLRRFEWFSLCHLHPLAIKNVNPHYVGCK